MRETTSKPGRDNITNNQASNSSSFSTPIQDVSPIKLKQDLLESKQANLEPDQKIDGPLTADVFYKYMKEYEEELQNSIRTGFSLVDLT